MSFDDHGLGKLSAVTGLVTSRLFKKSASFVLASLKGSTLRRSFSEVGSTVGAFPFAKTNCKGERPTRSAVCTSSPLHSLRPCWTDSLNSLRAVREPFATACALRFRYSRIVFQHPDRIQVGHRTEMLD